MSLKKLLPVLMLILTGSVTAQNISNDFTIHLQILQGDNLQTLYLSDLDLQNYGTAEELFLVTITKLSDRSYENCRFKVALFKDQEELVTATSNYFSIPSEFRSKTVNNIDLANDGLDFGAGPVRFDNVQISSSAENLRNEIMATGRIPVGIYRLVIELVQQPPSAGETPLARVEEQLLKATNPSFLNLVTPGVPAGSNQTFNIYSEFPVFQWNGNGSEYQVFVFEKKEMMQSYDDIINSEPNWVSERTTALSIQYPQAGTAIPLEANKTYYWFVRMYIQTSAGEEYIDSEVWEFTLVNPEQKSTLQDEMVQDELLQFLSRVLGPRIRDIKDDLKGYQLKRVEVNGEEISVDQLYKILESYQNQEFEVVEFIPPQKD